MSIPISVTTFIMFTDCMIYWIHRGLHIPFLYKRLHKTHHLWKVPTPFASHAFNPVDGFLQSIPYHIYVFLFPMHKYVYLFMFVFVNFWTVSIHDGDFRVPSLLKRFVNGSAHHTDHHLYYNYNYGQFVRNCHYFWKKLLQSHSYNEWNYVNFHSSPCGTGLEALSETRQHLKMIRHLTSCWDQAVAEDVLLKGRTAQNELYKTLSFKTTTFQNRSL